MPAPDFTTLLDFETNIETAATTFLATDTGLSASSLFATLDQDSFVVPRLEVMFESGEGIDPPTQQTTNSSQVEYMQNRGVLSIRVVSDASVTGTETTHRQLRAKIRRSMLLNADNFTTPSGDSTILPYYAIQYMRPTGTSYEVDGDLAVSTLTYEIIFSIKKDAFPSANLRLKTLNEEGAVVSIGSPFYDTSSPTLTSSFQAVGKIGLIQGSQTVNVTVSFIGYTINTASFTISNATNLQTVQSSGEFSFDVDTNSLSGGDNIDIGVFFEN
jgi:hypothetical protein